MASPARKSKAKPSNAGVTVFSNERHLKAPKIKLARGLHFNRRLKMDGLRFLSKLPEDSIPVAFFDPQYRGVLDKLAYGNEGKSRGASRAALAQMNEDVIKQFILGIDKALMPSGHLFLWVDKFHLLTGVKPWWKGTSLAMVDMLTWNKGKVGMGYRTRRCCEYLIVLQKKPQRAKGIWKVHNIPDTWLEAAIRNGHVHNKPVDLQGKLIEAVSNEKDIVIDPAAGSFSVLEACQNHNRNFLGCDING